MTIKTTSVVFSVLLVLAAANLSLAQRTTATFGGAVEDQSHAVLPGVQVSLINEGTATILQQVSGTVVIEGHCDDIGSDEYNLALGAKRAQIAKDFLVSHGVSADRLVTISYGKEAPACFEPTEECRVKNRRARFVVFTELSTSYTSVR